MDDIQGVQCFNSIPKLKSLFLILNTPIPASAACERLFSSAGLIFLPKASKHRFEEFGKSAIVEAKCQTIFEPMKKFQFLRNDVLGDILLNEIKFLLKADERYFVFRLFDIQNAWSVMAKSECYLVTTLFEVAPFV